MTGSAPLIAAEAPGIAPPIDRPAELVKRPERHALMGVARAQERLVAVGEAGIVILSDDHGQSWRQANVPVSVTLTDVAFGNKYTGWAVGHGGVVLRTEDGGANWNRLIDGREIAEMVLKDVQARIAAAGNDVPVTLELEKMRAERAVEGLPSDPMFSVHFQGVNNGLVVGAFGLILHTQDGGESWSLGRDLLTTDSHLYAIREIGGRFFIVGERGGFYEAKALNDTFETHTPPYDGTYFGIASLQNEGGLIAFGLNGRGVRASLLPGGMGWKAFTRMNGTSLTNGRLLSDGRVALTAVDGTLRLSSNNGEGFEVIETVPPAPLNDVVSTANGNILAVGMGGIRLVDAEILQ